MLRLYDNEVSRNGYKAVLLLNQLGVPFERVEIDILRGKSRTPEYLAVNPAGKIPALELEDGTMLGESCTILYYLAEGTPYLPDDRQARAQVLRWMFFEQNAHEPTIAEARFITQHPELSEGRAGDVLRDKRERGDGVLRFMNDHLAGREYFACGLYSIADIALYGYTSVAHEGGFDLLKYAAIQAWVRRIESQPGYVPANSQ